MARELLAKRRQFFPDCLYHSYEAPLEITQAQDQYYNEGHLLDLYNNVCHIGHSNPAVLRAITEAYSTVNINTRFLQPNLTDYAEYLAKYFPPEKKYKLLFTNSGSEANDLALRVALLAQDRHNECLSMPLGNKKHKNIKKHLVSLERSYHGTTALCDKVSHLHSTGKVKKADAAVVFLKPNNEYMLYKMLGPSMSGIIIEAIQGVGGNIPLQSAYLQKMFALAKYYNIITICDEVQTGFGRTGDTFWAFTQALAGSGYAPDIITGGKPMANGYPMGVCIIREDLAALLGDSYFNTFGGNSVACKVAWTVLRELEEKQLIKHCQELGAYLFQELSKLPFIAAVTGRGLFLGITLKPPYDSIKLVEKLKDQHILVGLGADAAANPGEISQPIIRIKPPLVVTKANLDFFLATLQQCILYKN